MEEGTGYNWAPLCARSHMQSHYLVEGLFFFLLFRAAPAAHGSFQARGPIRPTVASLCHSHSNISMSHIHGSQQRWILSPLSKARDQTYNLTIPSQICFHCTMTGTPTWKVLLLLSISQDELGLAAGGNSLQSVMLNHLGLCLTSSGCSLQG